jgi:hypothetical protein
MGTIADLRKIGKEFFTDDDGLDWSNILKTGAGAAAIYGILNPNDSQGLASFFGTGGRQQPVGYTEGIPKYTLGNVLDDGSRQLADGAFATTIPQQIANEQGTMETVNVPRIPGSMGRRYFTDTSFLPVTPAEGMAMGGIVGYAGGGQPQIQYYYLGGPTDGMADQIPAIIDNMQPAALSDGEFVIPADVVSHLGNGNSDAGAQNLYSMMERIRKDRTGNPNQGRQIDPNKYLA